MTVPQLNGIIDTNFSDMKGRLVPLNKREKINKVWAAVQQENEARARALRNYNRSEIPAEPGTARRIGNYGGNYSSGNMSNDRMDGSGINTGTGASYRPSDDPTPSSGDSTTGSGNKKSGRRRRRRRKRSSSLSIVVSDGSPPRDPCRNKEKSISNGNGNNKNDNGNRKMKKRKSKKRDKKNKKKEKKDKNDSKLRWCEVNCRKMKIGNSVYDLNTRNGGRNKSKNKGGKKKKNGKEKKKIGKKEMRLFNSKLDEMKKNKRINKKGRNKVSKLEFLF